MAFHIDLLHEHHEQEHARRTDPLRMGILAIMVIGLGMVGYYSFKSNAYRILKNEQTQLETQWKEKEPQMKEAEEAEEELRTEIKASESLLARVEGRFFWGPLLEEILKLVPDSVQIKSFEGKLDNDKQELNLSISGIGAGDKPRQVSEGFRQALIDKFSKIYPDATANFKTLEDDTMLVPLHGKTLLTARYSIDVKIKYRNTPDEPEKTK